VTVLSVWGFCVVSNTIIPKTEDFFNSYFSKTYFGQVCAEIEKDLIEYFHDAVHKNQGNTPIFKAKEYAVKCIAEKHNFTIEEANRFVSEMQMRKLDKELFDDNET